MITIISEPQTFSPVYNDLFFEASSDNILEPGFNYIFDIYFDFILQTRHRIPSRPSDNNGLFNAMRIMESQVTSESLTDLDTMFTNHNEFWKKFQVKIGEEYEVTGVTTVFPDLATSSYVFAFNGVFDYLDYVNYLDTDYLLLNVSKRFLTNAPDTKIQLGERAWLYTVNDVPTDYDRKQVVTYDSAGAVVSTYNINSALNTNTDANKFIRVTAGPYHLSLEAVSFTNVSYYTIQAQTSAGVAISELKRFNLDSECSKYEKVRIHFLNKLGAFDSYSFTLLSEKDYEIKRSDFQRSYTNVKATSDRLQLTSNTTIRDGIVLNSNYLSEAEYLWLTELITSPIIFQELNNELIALKCVETKYKEKKKDNDKLFNLTLNFDYTYTNNRQRY